MLSDLYPFCELTLRITSLNNKLVDDCIPESDFKLVESFSHYSSVAERTTREALVLVIWRLFWERTVRETENLKI